MRERIYEIIEKAEQNDKWSKVYDCFMIVVIVVSLVPLVFKEDTSLLIAVDKVTVAVFIVDYLLRFLTADFKYDSKTLASFLRYPFSFMAIIDLMSILPSLSFVNAGFKLLRVLRMLRAMRVFRVFKTFRYTKTFEIIKNVLRSSRDSLLSVGALAVGYILVSAMIIFNVEPESFSTFFDAVYWATVSLTTVGYGDIYPVSLFGRLVTMFSSMFGIAVVALPAGIITAGYMNELQKKEDSSQK